jgi:penicillin-binding protein 1A
MALGAVEVSPIEMAQAYDAFANGGKRVEAYGISRIRTPQGRVIYQHGSGDGRRSGDQQPASSTI